MRTATALLFAAGVLCSAPQVGAAPRRVLPVPDGGIDPSPVNLRGRVVSIALPLVRIRADGTGRVKSVILPETLLIYSAFGGDTVQSELRIGQHASVWFQGCKAICNETPVVGYFQIYSLDPADQPARRSRPSKSGL